MVKFTLFSTEIWGMEKVAASKIPEFIKLLLPYIKQILPQILTFLSGITLASIIAWLGRFFDFFAYIARIQIPLLLLIVIFPLLLYAVVTMIRSIIGVIKKPSYTKFSSMKYEAWRLEWDYEHDKKTKKYLIKNMRPVCPDCGCELAEWDDARVEGLHCPICKNLWYPEFDKHQTVHKIIEHKIKQWSDKPINLQPTPVKVYNTLLIPVTLSAGGYLCNEPMTIPANGNNSGYTIYTKTPAFIASAKNLPAITNFQVVDGVMIVTIR